MGRCRGRPSTSTQRSRDTTVQKWEFEGLRLTLRGDRATLVGKFIFSIKIEDVPFDFVDRFVWRDGRWQATGSEVTPINKEVSMSIITDVIESTKAIIQGMGVTLSYIPKRKWTVEYPDEPVTVQPRYRGQHLLHVDEHGREKCVACFLCAAACPSECIYIVAADDPRPAA